MPLVKAEKPVPARAIDPASVCFKLWGKASAELFRGCGRSCTPEWLHQHADAVAQPEDRADVVHGLERGRQCIYTDRPSGPGPGTAQSISLGKCSWQ